mmetsp:Transcript_73417/g.203883  ORF Transcript_73417/g.203883 Transcript_73417/m.203883 type:complete len:316 (+) Transcript_73417:672-1619(+)
MWGSERVEQTLPGQSSANRVPRGAPPLTRPRPHAWSIPPASAPPLPAAPRAAAGAAGRRPSVRGGAARASLPARCHAGKHVPPRRTSSESRAPRPKPRKTKHAGGRSPRPRGSRRSPATAPAHRRAGPRDEGSERRRGSAACPRAWTNFDTPWRGSRIQPPARKPWRPTSHTRSKSPRRRRRRHFQALLGSGLPQAETRKPYVAGLCPPTEVVRQRHVDRSCQQGWNLQIFPALAVRASPPASAGSLRTWLKCNNCCPCPNSSISRRPAVPGPLANSAGRFPCRGPQGRADESRRGQTTPSGPTSGPRSSDAGGK